MSIEVQKAPIISQIVLDKSKNDLHFSLDENGVITNSTSKKTTSKFSKTNDFEEDKYGSMASKYSDGYDSYDDDFEDDSPARNGSRTRTRDRQDSLISENHSNYSYTPSPPTTRRNKKTASNSSRRNSLVSYRSAYGVSRGKIVFFYSKIGKYDKLNLSQMFRLCMLHFLRNVYLLFTYTNSKYFDRSSYQNNDVLSEEIFYSFLFFFILI